MVRKLQDFELAAGLATLQKQRMRALVENKNQILTTIVNAAHRTPGLNFLQ